MLISTYSWIIGFVFCFFFSLNLLLAWNSVWWNSQLTHCGVNLHFADPVNDYLRIIGASKLVPALRRCAWGRLQDCLKCNCLPWGAESGGGFVSGLIYPESARLQQPLSLGPNLERTMLNVGLWSGCEMGVETRCLGKMKEFSHSNNYCYGTVRSWIWSSFELLWTFYIYFGLSFSLPIWFGPQKYSFKTFKWHI